MTEQQPFQVVRRYTGFDLRRYPSHAVAQVTVTSSFDRAGSIAFRSLFGYITGQNRSRSSVAMTAPVVQSAAPSHKVASEKVAMTAPVLQQPNDDGDHVVAFVLPAALTVDTAPIPTNPDVELRTVPGSLTAAKAYSGRWSRSSYQRQCSELLDAVATEGLRPIGAPRFARYDPPFKPWFLRHNEVLVDTQEIDTQEIDTEEIDTEEIDTEEIDTEEIDTEEVGTGEVVREESSTSN